MNFYKLLSTFVGPFLPSWIRIRIRIPNTDPDPVPQTQLNTDPIRIRLRIHNPDHNKGTQLPAAGKRGRMHEGGGGPCAIPAGSFPISSGGFIAGLTVNFPHPAK
jgi:hypothetical protein